MTKMGEGSEFEVDLLAVIMNHFGDNFSYSWDAEENGYYIRLRVWEKEEV